LLLCIIYCCCYCRKQKTQKDKKKDCIIEQNETRHEIICDSTCPLSARSGTNNDLRRHSFRCRRHSSVDKITQFNSKLDVNTNACDFSPKCSVNQNVSSIRANGPDVYLKIFSVSNEENGCQQNIETYNKLDSKVCSSSVIRNEYPCELEPQIYLKSTTITKDNSEDYNIIHKENLQDQIIDYPIEIDYNSDIFKPDEGFYSEKIGYVFNSRNTAFNEVNPNEEFISERREYSKHNVQNHLEQNNEIFAHYV
jgi:hypothetical protein